MYLLICGSLKSTKNNWVHKSQNISKISVCSVFQGIIFNGNPNIDAYIGALHKISHTQAVGAIIICLKGSYL
jgi:hypothetical protein